MMLGRLAAAAIILAATMSTICAAADHRLLVLEGSWVKWGVPQQSAGATVTYAFAPGCIDLTGRAQLRIAPAFRRTDQANRIVPASGEERDGGCLCLVGAGYRPHLHLRQKIPSTPISSSARRANRQAAPSRMSNSKPARRHRRQRSNAVLPSRPSLRRTAPRREDCGQIRKALICFNPLQKWKVGFDGNLDVYDIRYTLTHEIGHAIGLDHPGAAGALMGFRYDEKRNGLTKGDIEAAQRLYGPPGPARYLARDRTENRYPLFLITRRSRSLQVGST